jgi:hypothetical protein
MDRASKRSRGSTRVNYASYGGGSDSDEDRGAELKPAAKAPRPEEMAVVCHPSKGQNKPAPSVFAPGAVDSHAGCAAVEHQYLPLIRV